MPVVLAAVFLSSMFAPFVFLGKFLRGAWRHLLIANVLPKGRRNFAFELFYIGYGEGWFVGSVATGLLYEQSRVALVLFAVVVQLAFPPVFVMAQRLGHSGVST